MRKRVSKGDLAFSFVNYVLLTLLIVIIVYPVLHVVFASFSEPSLLRQHRGFLFGSLGFTFEGYTLVLRDPGILSGYLNTIQYVVVGVALNMILTSMGAFVLSRRQLYFKKYIMILVVITMFFGGGLIPFYLLVRNLGMNGSWWALIIPYGINTWNMIVLRTGFSTIPYELEESAYIDGANALTILVKIILPLSKATLAVILLYYVVGAWNAWFPAMIFLRDRGDYPLQLIIREVLVLNDTSNMGSSSNVSSLFAESTSYQQLVKYSTIVISSFPIMAFYPFVQKYFVQGIMLGSLKG